MHRGGGRGGGGGGRGGGGRGGGGRGGGGGGFHGGGGGFHGGGHFGPGSASRPHRRYTPYYNYIVNGYGGPYYDDYYDDYYTSSDPTPYDWIGKLLIREGHIIPTGIDLSTVILEHSMPDPHLIIGSGQLVPGYNPNRLLVYVDGNDVITAVRYG